MIDLLGAELPKGGHVIFLTATIGGAHTDINNQNHTVVYTDCFPAGVTIKMQCQEFFDLWLGCLLADYEEIEASELH